MDETTKRYAKRLQFGLDPSLLLASSVPGGLLDQWQIDFARSTQKRRHVKVHRQAGKSTSVASCAIHRAIFVPETLIIIGSPSQRQSVELFRKVKKAYQNQRREIGMQARTSERMLGVWKADIDDPSDVRQESVMQMELANGSRIVALPDNPDAVVGYSAASIVIIDEAARTSNEFYEAVRPMLATTDGDLWLISTPKGRRGFFWETSKECGGDKAAGWAHWSVPIVEPHPRITSEYLKDERSNGPRYWSQEWLVEFNENDGAVFSAKAIDAMFRDDVAPLFDEDDEDDEDDDE